MDRTVTFKQNTGLDTKTDKLTDCQSQSDSDSDWFRDESVLGRRQPREVRS
jgi:hypothetical protein